MNEFALERMVNHSWLTGMLVGTATNSPKTFPKTPESLLQKKIDKRPMTPDQWEKMIEYLLAAGKTKPTKGEEKKTA